MGAEGRGSSAALTQAQNLFAEGGISVSAPMRSFAIMSFAHSALRSSNVYTAG
jgi:hypothetical protein